MIYTYTHTHTHTHILFLLSFSFFYKVIEVKPARRKYKILELKNKECKVLNTTAIASGYTGHDPQGGTSDESFLQVLFSSQKMVKVLHSVL